MKALWHFTCGHGFAALGRRGCVVPPIVHSPEKMAGLPDPWAWLGDLVWFTDQFDGLGAVLGHITSTGCDRLRYRYAVQDASTCKPWGRYVHDHPGIITPDVRWWIEHTPSAFPGTWYVSPSPVPVELDRAYVRTHA